jgi:ABC-2 type transport system ATP-binding protein
MHDVTTGERMSSIIEIKGLTKQYGNLTALDELTLDIDEGAVFGFIGPNGAGKTTTMRLLTTLLKPTGGTAWVAGHSVTDDPRSVRRVIGYMPDFFGVYDDMKVWEYLDFFAACYDIPQSTRVGMVDDLLSLVDLGHKKEEFVENLSRGMKQRLCLARTLAHDPQVLILDEPASGLDPRARIEIRELLRELKHMGKTIFFSSHILSEVADVCTSIGIIEAGKLITHGDLGEIKGQLRAHRLVQVQVIGDIGPLQEALIHAEGVTGIDTGLDANLPPNAVRFDYAGSDEGLSQLLATLIRIGIPVLSFSEDTGDLEDVFMQMTKGVVN